MQCHNILRKCDKNVKIPKMLLHRIENFDIQIFEFSLIQLWYILLSSGPFERKCMSSLPQNRPKTDNLMAVKSEISNFRAMTLFPNICTIWTRRCIYIYIYYIYCKSSLRMCSFKCFDKQTMTLKSFFIFNRYCCTERWKCYSYRKAIPKGLRIIKGSVQNKPVTLPSIPNSAHSPS